MRACRVKTVLQQQAAIQVATMACQEACDMQEGCTFDLLSGCGTPSSLPSVLRGTESLDSLGDIISARPIDANGKQEKAGLYMGHGLALLT